jgi:hypothetical protein
MAPHAVDQDTQQLGLVLMELRKNLVVQRHLIATNRAPVGRIERQYYGLPRRLESVRLWSGVTRNVNSGAAVPAATMDDISCFTRVGEGSARSPASYN